MEPPARLRIRPLLLTTILSIDHEYGMEESFRKVLFLLKHDQTPPKSRIPIPTSLIKTLSCVISRIVSL